MTSEIKPCTQECFVEGLFLCTSKQCKVCDDQAKCEEHSMMLASRAMYTATKKTPPKKKKSQAGKQQKVKDKVLELLGDKSLVGKTYNQLADIVREEVKGARTAGSYVCNCYMKYKNEMELLPRKHGRRKKGTVKK